MSGLWLRVGEIPNIPGEPPRDRERHCWVNCVIKRINLIVLPPDPWLDIYNFGKEFFDRDGAADSGADLASDYYGQLVALVIWKDSKTLCLQCPARRQ